MASKEVDKPMVQDDDPLTLELNAIITQNLSIGVSTLNDELTYDDLVDSMDMKSNASGHWRRG